MAGQGREDTEKCKIAQKLPACKIGLYTLKSMRDAPAARTDRDSTDKMNAIYVRFQLRQFWRGGTADF